MFFRVHNGSNQFNIDGQDTEIPTNGNWSDLTSSTNGAIKIADAGNYTVRVDNANKRIALVPAATYTFTIPTLAGGTVSATYKGQTQTTGTFTDVPAGSKIVLSLNPPTGKKVTGVTCDGDGATVTGSGNSWTVTMPSANISSSDWHITLADQGTVTVYFNNIKTRYAKPKAYAWYGSDDRSSVTAEFTEAWTGTAMTRLPNSNIWYIENIPADAKITFVGDNGVNTGKLGIPSGDSAPRYNPGSDPGSPATGGSWSTYTPVTTK